MLSSTEPVSSSSDSEESKNYNEKYQIRASAETMTHTFEAPSFKNLSWILLPLAQPAFIAFISPLQYS